MQSIMRPGRSRTVALVIVLLVSISGIAAWLQADPLAARPLSQSADPMLPDLVMSPIADASGTVLNVPLEPFLAFSATIANVGEGDFIVAARRSWPWSDDWTVAQRVQERGGGFTERMTPAGMVYGGDQHDHWHVRAVESHRLERIDTGEVLAEVVKLGFCFFDVQAVVPAVDRAPTAPRWLETACDGTAATRLTIGLSVGWEDVYPSDMREQAIPLTGVPSGLYRLHEIADPNDQFEESDETNNETSVDIRVDLPSSGFPRVTVVGDEPGG